MKGNSRLPRRSNEGFYRYLKPGALAQLRDSKISSRSTRSNSFLTRSVVPRVGSPLPQIPIQSEDQIDRIPNFLYEVYGPRCIRRKKFVAARSALL